MMNLIVAYCKNRGIGYKNTLPWRLPPDMKYFKKNTIGEGRNAVIMGRNTFESLNKKPLSKRLNIILTKNPKYFKEVEYYSNIKFANSLEQAKYICKEKSIIEKWVIGGETIYNEAIDRNFVSCIYATEINNDYKCDTYFPKLDSNFYLYDESSMQNYKGIEYKYKLFADKFYSPFFIS